jgi:hypothetical protein
MGVLNKLNNMAGGLAKYVLPNYLPDFIIIGAQKAGTSFLHHYLSQHPDLQGSEPKEIHYFDKKIHQGYDLSWYKRNFIRKSLKRKLYFEATPKYVYHDDIPKYLYDMNPNIKLILALREPVARAYSAWNMFFDIFNKKMPHAPDRNGGVYKYLFEGRSEFPSFKEAIEIELKLIENNESPEPSFLRRGLYGQQLKSWMKYFDEEQLLVLGFNELTSDMESSFNVVTDFLGCSPLKIDPVEMKPQNKRSYDSKMSEEERAFLENYYSGTKADVKKLLGREIDW